MFGHLKSVVDLIRSGIADFRKFKTDKEREETILGVLKAYFLLKDCVDEGETLIADAGPDPVGKINAMEASEALSTLERWDAVIRRQGIRLYTLQGYIFGQDHLAVINPALQERIGEIIGYKMDRAVTLHGIGSALFFRNVFPVADTNEEKARYVSVMASAEHDTLDLAKVKAEIAGLREALDQYRSVVERLVSNEELMRLSRRARQETSFRGGA
jgi:hypothetical protein